VGALEIFGGTVTTVTLNRPDVRNALDDGLIAEVAAWADRVTAGGGTRVAVLRGAGAYFCAGADLRWMKRMASYTTAENHEDARAAARMLHALDRLPVPLIGRVQGGAFGGGAGLVALCDIAVATDDAVFAFSETTLGMVPAMIAPYVVRRIGVSAARRFCTSGERFSARQALEMGLVHEVVPAADLDATVERHVRQYLRTAPSAVAATKQLLADVAGRLPADVLALTADTIARQRASSEGQEGLRAFLEHRQPAWVTEAPGSTPPTDAAPQTPRPRTQASKRAQPPKRPRR
jgi:methylglutaconyl-CoA hydratase